MKNNIKRLLLVMVLAFTLVAFAGCNFTIGGSISSGNNITIKGKTKIDVGETTQLTATVTPNTLNQEVVWESNNPEVLSIDAEGVIVGLKAGRATVSATSVAKPDLVAYTYINVVKTTIVDQTLAPTNIILTGFKKMYIGEMTNFKVEVEPENANPKVIWESNNSLVASVDETGHVYAIAPGKATIKATSVMNSEVSAEISIYVITSVRDDDIEKAIQDVFEKTKDSILGVSNYQYDSLTKKLAINSIGSGFIYDAWAILDDGTEIHDIDSISNKSTIKSYRYNLLTNKHVVEGSDAVKVYMHQIDEEVDAYLIQYDTKIDIAVVSFEYSEYLEPLRFADCTNLKSGSFAIAIGNPESFDFSSSLTFGVISAAKRYIATDTDGDDVNDWDAEYIQHDVAINPGNSGGPLLNLYGQVIGVNTLKFASTEIDNMGFSIPSNEILGILNYLERGEVPTRATIGVTVIAIRDVLKVSSEYLDYDYIIPSNVKTGLYVTAVVAGSVAEKGGLLADDIIVSFNGVNLVESLQLRAELNKIVVGSGEEILVKVIRDGKEIEVKLVF